MKSRPEYKAVFSSPVMFFRVLHIISTSRYRLPVRRYIMDLFNVDLDAQVVATIVECGKTLKASPSYRLPQSDLNRRLSMFGRTRNPEESDEDDEDDEEPPPLPNTRKEQPPLNLRPMSRIVGFAS